MLINNFRKAEPKAYIPSEIADLTELAAPQLLFGYYVANTEYFNIMPIDNDPIVDSKKVYPLGYIFPDNPFVDLGGEFCQGLKMLEIVVDFSISASERLKKRNRRLSHAISVEEKNLLLSSIKKHYNSLASSIEKVYHTEEERSEEIIGFISDGKLHIIQLSTLTEVRLEPYSLRLDVFSRNTGILESDVMLNKRALFIGCGSVGSLVAVELAKAGVGSFMLVDMDIFGYHNICRHQCGTYDVGRYKTDAVGDRIWQINPYAKVTKYNCAIQDVDQDVIKAFCTKDTIIIGGADNRDGDHYACKFAMQGEGAFISIGCWERAFAGEIFYCLPGMPDYSDFLNAIGYVSGRVTQNRRFYTTEEELEKVSFEPGISADINFVTIVAVKIALDLLNRDNDKFTQRLLPHISQYTLVCNTIETSIGGEQAEIFSYPLQVSTSITVPFSNRN